jgi:hypothetical protein
VVLICTEIEEDPVFGNATLYLKVGTLPTDRGADLTGFLITSSLIVVTRDYVRVQPEGRRMPTFREGDVGGSQPPPPASQL